MPAPNSYFPIRLGDRSMWLKNYRLKIGNYQTAGGYTVAEIAATQADADFCGAVVSVLQPQVATYAQAITAYARLIFEGPASATPVPVPACTVSVTVPPVPPGALKRIFAFVVNMKTRPFCTPAVRQDLGIDGPPAAAPDPAVQPALKVQLTTGGRPELAWKKGKFAGLRVQIDRGDGQGWVNLTVTMMPRFTDQLSPLPAAGQAALWQYRAIYIIADADFGQWSNAVSVMVAG